MPSNTTATILGNPTNDLLCNEELNAPITEAEVSNALKRLVSGKSGGKDKVTTDMLKSSQNLMLPYLLKIFSMIFDTGTFPEIWRDAIIIPIHKRGAHDNPDNYRGIALTSRLSKVFLHIIKW